MNFSKNDTISVSFSEVLERKENLQRKFFRDCIKKTNQFSAQFVLDKMFQEHLRHFEELENEVGILKDEIISKDLCRTFQSELYFANLCERYDLSTLTLSEATRITIHMEERDLDFFRGVLDNPLSGDSKKALRKIISSKTNFIKYLKREQARLLAQE